VILPMKKVCIMVQEKSREDALKKLRAVGVVHLEKKEVSLDANSSALKRKTKCEDAMGLIQEFKLPKKKKSIDPAGGPVGRERRQKHTGMHRGRRATDVFGTDEEAPYSLDAVRAAVRPFLPDLLLGFGDERKELKEQDFTLGREIARIEEWGDFDPSTVQEVITYGIPVYLYEISPDVFSGIDKNANYIKLAGKKNVVRLIVFYEKLQGIVPFALPEKSLTILKAEHEKIVTDLKAIEEKLSRFADRRPALNKDMAKVLYDLEFETASAHMEKVTDIPAEAGLCWLTGYVPQEDVERLIKAVKDNAWGISFDDPPKADERIPTKLKNNKLVDLLKPVTGFLEIVPGYREVDISPIFLFFFCIFFSMIYGDAGYGLIFVAMGLAGVISTIARKKKMPLAFPMLLLLGTCNTIWGVLTCAWFGMSYEILPEFLRDISLSYISLAKTDQVMVNQNLQIFCFTLGLVHLSVAHIVNMIRAKSLRILGELGSIMMLLGMYNVVLMLIVSNDVRSIPLHPYAIHVIGGGWLLNFLFGAYVTGMGQAIKSSLGNIMSVILGVVSIFSDIMSYIRLWAVGLAGAAIAGTVNLLAGPMLSGFMIFAGVTLLIFGHGMILVLNVLSVLVHGVRLNTLEFSGHVGLAWSGTAYKPFAEKEIK